MIRARAASKHSGGSKGGAPLRTKMFLISCSFWENPANLYVGAPQGLAPPPTGNPVSVPETLPKNNHNEDLDCYIKIT